MVKVLKEISITEKWIYCCLNFETQHMHMVLENVLHEPSILHYLPWLNKFIFKENMVFIKTTGPWATSLTWENSSNQLTHTCMIIIMWLTEKNIIYFLRMEWLFLFYENGMVLNWTNLNPLHPGMLCAKFGWTWPNG